MRVALAQIEVGADKTQNLERIALRAAEAARSGARLVIFPEAAMVHFGDAGRSLAGEAERLDGPFATGLRRLAREQRIAIACGMFEPAGGGRVLNTVGVFGPDGELAGAYRKIHLYDAFGFRESDNVEPGPGDLLTFELDGLRFGVMTCYDVRFPEIARALVDRGAGAIVLPAAWVPGPLKTEHWEVLVRARAIENTVYVLAADAIGPESAGSSMVVDPMGVIVARAGETEALVVAEVLPERIEAARRENPSLRNRRFGVRASEVSAPAR